MLEQDLIVEIHERPAPECDDERRRYYRITPFGRTVARAEARRLQRSGQAGTRQRLCSRRRVDAGSTARCSISIPRRSAPSTARRWARCSPAISRRAASARVARPAIADTLVNAVARAPRHHAPGSSLHLRSLGRTPGFTVTAIVVAALGIGATTATFSIADHVLLRPLPFPRAGSPGQALGEPVEPRLLTPGGVAANFPRLATHERCRSTGCRRTRGVSANLIGEGDPGTARRRGRSRPTCFRIAWPPAGDRPCPHRDADARARLNSRS